MWNTTFTLSAVPAAKYAKAFAGLVMYRHSSGSRPSVERRRIEIAENEVQATFARLHQASQRLTPATRGHRARPMEFPAQRRSQLPWPWPVLSHELRRPRPRRRGLEARRPTVVRERRSLRRWDLGARDRKRTLPDVGRREVRAIPDAETAVGAMTGAIRLIKPLDRHQVQLSSDRSSDHFPPQPIKVERRLVPKPKKLSAIAIRLRGQCRRAVPRLRNAVGAEIQCIAIVGVGQRDIDSVPFSPSFLSVVDCLQGDVRLPCQSLRPTVDVGGRGRAPGHGDLVWRLKTPRNP